MLLGYYDLEKRVSGLFLFEGNQKLNQAKCSHKYVSVYLIDANTNVAAKKQGKKGEFAEPAARLIQAGGFASLLIFPLLKQL